MSTSKRPTVGVRSVQSSGRFSVSQARSSLRNCASSGVSLKSTREMYAVASAQLRQDFRFVEPDHAFLVRTHLRDVYLVEARVDVLLKRRNVLVGVGAAGDLLGHHLLGDQFACLGEVGRRGEVLRQLTRDKGVP